VIGILVATRAEAQILLKKSYGFKKDGIYHFRTKLAGRETAIYLTRPGIPAKEQMRRFLRLYQFEAIISTGTAASLTAEFKHLDIVEVTDMVRVATVSHLVTRDSDKAEIHSRTKAALLDMETETIQAIFSESEFRALKLCILRLVDDLPGEENYLEKEKLLRSLPTRPALNQIIRFGIWDYFRILWRRHKIALAIGRAVRDKIVDGFR